MLSEKDLSRCVSARCSGYIKGVSRVKLMGVQRTGPLSELDFQAIVDAV